MVSGSCTKFGRYFNSSMHRPSTQTQYRIPPTQSHGAILDLSFSLFGFSFSSISEMRIFPLNRCQINLIRQQQAAKEANRSKIEEDEKAREKVPPLVGTYMQREGGKASLSFIAKTRKRIEQKIFRATNTLYLVLAKGVKRKSHDHIRRYVPLEILNVQCLPILVALRKLVLSLRVFFGNMNIVNTNLTNSSSGKLESSYHQPNNLISRRGRRPGDLFAFDSFLNCLTELSTIAEQMTHNIDRGKKGNLYRAAE